MLNIIDPLKGFALPNIGVHVSAGVLLSPDAFQRECQRTKQQPTFDAWAVYARMPDRVVRLMESPVVPLGSAFSIMASHAGPVYPVVIHQMAGLQLRTVLCLQDDQTQEWLRHSAERGKVTLALEVEETAQLAVLSSDCGALPSHEAESLIASCRPLSRDELLLDVEKLVRQLVDTRAVPSTIDGIEVDSVRLVLACGEPRSPTADAPQPQPRPLH